MNGSGSVHQINELPNYAVSPIYPRTLQSTLQVNVERTYEALTMSTSQTHDIHPGEGIGFLLLVLALPLWRG